jgi:hypothetical protein
VLAPPWDRRQPFVRLFSNFPWVNVVDPQRERERERERECGFQQRFCLRRLLAPATCACWVHPGAGNKQRLELKLLCSCYHQHVARDLLSSSRIEAIASQWAVNSCHLSQTPLPPPPPLVFFKVFLSHTWIYFTRNFVLLKNRKSSCSSVPWL